MPEIQSSSRRKDIDILKGISIICVVFYHLGILKSGYLGVDAFFVIAGFLTVPGLVRKIDKFSSTVKYIVDKIVRLLPTVLIASILCLAVGYFLWLPDDYENLSQSIIASSFFSNNILSAITTKNYWDTVNDFKPFMHTWYLGILMEFYVVACGSVFFIRKICKGNLQKTVKVSNYFFIVATVISLGLFLIPSFSSGDKFYFLQFRFYEFGIGALLGLNKEKIQNVQFLKKQWVSVASLVLVVALFVSGIVFFKWSELGRETSIIGAGNIQSDGLILPNQYLVIITVVLSAIFLASAWNNKAFQNEKIISAIGVRSFSFYVWHQVLLALYRYSVGIKISLLFLLCYIGIITIISEINYRTIEKHLKTSKKSVVSVALVAVVVLGVCGKLYLDAGMVRDVPELGLSVENASRGAHAEYCDRINKYNKDFSNEENIKVLVVGNSFARDFANVLLESHLADRIEISYSSTCDGLADRISKADRVFIFSGYNTLPDVLIDNVVSKDIIYGIGTKNYGSNNGNIYSKRFSSDYYEQTVPLDMGYEELNERWKQEWGEKYIDMISPVLENGRVKVFTDNRKYISQDCRHLTKDGAVYYTKLLNLDKYFEGLL